MNVDDTSRGAARDEHRRAQRWTVGQLRAALHDIPADTPLLVSPAEGTGGQAAAGDHVIVAAGRHRYVWRDHEELSVEFVLSSAPAS